jgi:hypothetical protein
VFSCKKKVVEQPDLGYNYSPITIGKYVIYDVDSVVYDDFNKDTSYFKYRIKEKLEESFKDNQGRDAIKMVRYIKMFDPDVPYDNQSWTIKDVWTYTRTKTTLEVTEEDVKFIKLAFPLRQNLSWNGNAQNTFGDQNYKYLSINLKDNINGTRFDSVLFVEQLDDKNRNAIQRKYFVEKYAKNVGLIYREIKELYSNTVIPGLSVEQRIEKGVIYKLIYVTHGKE